MKSTEPGQSFPLPTDLRTVFEALSRAGGRPLLAGGCVRDWLLGHLPKDFDAEVYGLTWEQLLKVLQPFGRTDPVGKQFAVVKLRLEEGEVDLALPRKESKSGQGHRGFTIEVDPTLDFTAACARRDFTLNAILYDPLRKEIIDPHNGAKDLRNGLLRHPSPAFREDPLRVLRAFQFVARFGFHVASETIRECQDIHSTFGEIPRERVWMEWEKVATKAIAPRAAFQFLEECNWMDHFPFLPTMRQTQQDPEWHPEGDVWEHTTHALESLVSLHEWREAKDSSRIILFFATLLHDVGKIRTTGSAWKNGRTCIVSPGHDREGGPLAHQFLQFLGSPHRYYAPVVKLVENHMATMSWPSPTPSASTVRRLARKIDPARLADLIPVIKADRGGRPPRPAGRHDDLNELSRVADELAIRDARPEPLLLGRHLIADGWTPGPEFTHVLNAIYEEQLEGRVTTIAEGLTLARQRKSAASGGKSGESMK